MYIYLYRFSLYLPMYTYTDVHTHMCTQIFNHELFYFKFKMPKTTSAPPWAHQNLNLLQPNPTVTHTIILQIFQTKILGVIPDDFSPQPFYLPSTNLTSSGPTFIPSIFLSLSLFPSTILINFYYSNNF